MTLDFSKCRLVPFDHQREDAEWLTTLPYALVASEMRTGKSKITIDAAQFLFEQDLIERVIIVAPAPVRDVWYDPTLGELKKHLWHTTHAKVFEFHSRLRMWEWVAPETQDKKALEFYATNYEFLRSRNRLVQLMAACGPKTLLVLDESSFVKNHNAEQTKACMQLRKKCGRVVMLNGTPIYHSPLDLFSQGNILHPSILECPYISLFKARYAVQQPVLGFGGKPVKKTVGKGIFTKDIIIQEIVDWTNMEDLQRRFAPYTVRRLQKECLDLPPKLDPVTLTATLESETWRAYRDMRDELVVWLKSGQVVTSASAAIKTLRLAQITGGFLSGAEDANIEPVEPELLEFVDLPGSFLDGLKLQPEGAIALQKQTEHFNSVIIESGLERGVTEVGREKLDVLLWFIEQRLEEDPNLHIVIWTRFRAELFRTQAEILKKFPQFQVGSIHGSQKRNDRTAALALLKPETSPVGPVCVVGIEGTGSFGLDMTAAHTCVTMSSGYSPGRVAQTLDRVYGPGQKHPIAYFNIVAVGPKGQRTIDHDILIARMNGEDLASRTAAAWVARLTEEL